MLRVLTILTYLVLSLGANTSYAEYRVYELAITGPNGTRTVRGTLDDQQYRGYYPLYTGETIKINAMWMCWERSDYSKPYCDQPVPAPRAPSAAAPAAN